jgi:hypothetical protein
VVLDLVLDLTRRLIRLLPLVFRLLLLLRRLVGVRDLRGGIWTHRGPFEEGDQVDQAEGAADDQAGAVGGEGWGAFPGFEEDDQGAGVVAANPGVDAVAVAGGDVEDDGGRGGGGPGGGAVGWVEAGDLDAAAGDRLETRPEEGIAGDEQDRLCHGPPSPDLVARMARILPAVTGKDNEIPTSPLRPAGDMLRG